MPFTLRRQFRETSCVGVPPDEVLVPNIGPLELVVSASWPDNAWGIDDRRCLDSFCVAVAVAT